MKRETSAKFSTIERTYEAVNEDLKILSQKIEGVKKCCVDSDKLIGTVSMKLKMKLKTLERRWKIKSTKKIWKKH